MALFCPFVYADTPISNDIFELHAYTNPTNVNQRLCHFMLKKKKDYEKEDMELLSKSLQLVCNDPGNKNCVILDCLLLNKFESVNRLAQVSSQTMDAVGNNGLHRFVIVSESSIVSALCKQIINIRKAQSYTRVCSNYEDAMNYMLG